MSYVGTSNQLILTRMVFIAIPGIGNQSDPAPENGADFLLIGVLVTGGEAVVSPGDQTLDRQLFLKLSSPFPGGRPPTNYLDSHA